MLKWVGSISAVQDHVVRNLC